MPHILINDLNVFYESHGHGEPLVLIAGFACDHTYWIGMLEALKQHFQILVFDNRAVGQTKDSGQPFTIDTLADDTLSLIKKLGLCRPHMVGHSMGGAIAQVIARKYPNEVNKLVLLNSSAKVNAGMMGVLMGHLQMRKDNIPMDIILNESLPWFFSQEFLPDPVRATEFKKLIMNNPYFQSIEDQARQLNALMQFDSTSWLDDIQAPTLVVGSVDDKVSLPQDTLFLAENISNSKIEFIPGGHSSPIEQPSRLSRTMIDYLLD